MLLSAFAAFYVALISGSLWLGLLAAALVGLAMGLLMSLVSVTLKAEQGVSGIGLYMFGLGMSSLLFKVLDRHRQDPGRLSSRWPSPSWRTFPSSARCCSATNILVYGAFLLVPLAWWVLEKTTLGPERSSRWDRARPPRTPSASASTASATSASASVGAGRHRGRIALHLAARISSRTISRRGRAS